MSSTLPNALDQLVATDDPINALAMIAKTKHTILERHSFSAVGNTGKSSQESSAFAVRPSVLHFGGFTLGKSHAQHFTVTNTGTKSRRVTVVHPETRFFKVGDGDAKSAKHAVGAGGSTPKPSSKLAPGASVRFAIHFAPDDGIRYYYDCVRIHCEGVPGILLPAHAYPVMNAAEVPKSVDFGLREVGGTYTKTFSIRCDVPIAFEYELVRIEKPGLKEISEKKGNVPGECFEVTPMRGVVPAEGSARVTISYVPHAASTSTMALEVRVSQFGFVPRTCQVRGTGFPRSRVSGKASTGVSRLETRDGFEQPGNSSRRLMNLPEFPSENSAAAVPREARGFDSSRTLGERPNAVRPVPPPRLSRRLPEPFQETSASAILAAFDLRAAGYSKAEAEEMVRRTSSVASAFEAKRSAREPALGPRGRKLSARADGRSKTEFASSPESAAESGEDERGDGDGVARALRQERGKRRWKDSEKATRANAAVTLRRSMATPACAIVKMKASAAAATFRKMVVAAKARRRNEDRNGDGEDEDGEVLDAARLRSKSEDETMAALDDPELDEEVKRLVFQREYERVGAFEKQKEWTDCAAIGSDAFSEKEKVLVLRRRVERERMSRFAEASAAMARLARGEPTTLGASYYVDGDSNVDETETFAPRFDPLSADEWPKRREALDRFVQAGRKVIVRNRADRRLKGIRTLMRAVGDPSRASAYVAREVIGARRSSVVFHTRVNTSNGIPNASETFLARRFLEDEEARFGIARLDKLRASLCATSEDHHSAADAKRVTTPTPRRFAERSPIFPRVIDRRFAERNVVSESEITPIEPWEEIAPLPPRTIPTWRLRGYGGGFSEDSRHRSKCLESSPPKVEGDGQFPKPSEIPNASAGAEEEESTGVSHSRRANTRDEEVEDPRDAEIFSRTLRSAVRIASRVIPDRPLFETELGVPSWKKTPTRNHPSISSAATPGGRFEHARDLDASILPATYDHEDSLTTEPAGMNGIRAEDGFTSLSSVPSADVSVDALTLGAGKGFPSRCVSEEWHVRFTLNRGTSSEADAEAEEEWMSGPDAADDWEAEGEGDDAAAAAAAAPTLESVAREIYRMTRRNGKDGKDRDARASVVVAGGVSERFLFELAADAASKSARETRMAQLETAADEADSEILDPRARWRIKG